MKTYRRLFSYARPLGKFILPFSFFTIAAAFFSVFQFALIIPLLNFLFNPVNTADAARYTTAPEFSLSANFFKDYFYYLIYDFKLTNPAYALYFLAAMIVISVVLTNICRYMAQRCLVNTRTLLVKRLREALFEKINHLAKGHIFIRYLWILYAGSCTVRA